MFSSILGEKRVRLDSAPPSPTVPPVGEDASTKLMSDLKSFIRAELQDAKSALVSAMTEVFNPIKAELQQEITSLRDQFVTMQDAFSTQIHSVVNSSVEAAIQSKFCVVEETVRAGFEALDNKITQCESSLDVLERKIRSPNSILFGVEESIGEKQLTEVKALIGPSIKEAIRLGKFVKTANRPRPVLIRFESIAAKHAAYKKAKELRQKFKISMDDDITPLQRAARTSLLPQAQALRAEGWNTFWRGEHLFKVKGQGTPIKVQPSTAPAGAPASSPAAPGAPPSSSAGPSSSA